MGLKSNDWCSYENRKFWLQKTHTEEDRHAKTEAEGRAMQLQVKDAKGCQQQPEAGKK